MSREIKFRAWDTMLEKMLDMKEIERSGMNLFALCEGSKLVNLMQYTGLTDRNGKEIYEGDVIKGEAINWADSGHYGGTRVTLGIVQYDHGRFFLEDKDTGARPDLAVGSAYHEIIGNIYEHPELLEG